jgi:hypothetical protein
MKMNRRDFLSLTGCTALSCAFPPLTSGKTISKYHKVAMVGGICENVLMIDNLPAGNYAKYENNDTAYCMYHHDQDIGGLSRVHATMMKQNSSFNGIIRGASHDHNVMIPTGHKAGSRKDKNEILRIEDSVFLHTLYNAWLPDNKNKIIRCNRVGISEIHQSFHKIEKCEFTVGNIVMHPDMYIRLKKDKRFLDQMDENTTFDGNWVAWLWAGNIRLTDLMEKNDIIFFARPEYVGVNAIRAEYEVEDFDLLIRQSNPCIINKDSIFILRMV